MTGIVNQGANRQTIRVLSAKAVDSTTAAITVQLPFDLAVPAPNTTALSYTLQFAQTATPDGDICAEHHCTAPQSVTVTYANPHILNTCDLLYANPATNQCQPVVNHADGQLVTADNPGKPGETLVLWAVGLGLPKDGIPAGATGPIAMTDIMFSATLLQQFRPDDDGTDTGTGMGQIPSTYTYAFAGLSDPSVGIYQVNFTVPLPSAELLACEPSTSGATGNLSLYVSRNPSPQWISSPVLIAGPLPVFSNGASFLLGYPQGVICIAE